MRYKKPNEKAVMNMLLFLREINERCEGGNLTAVRWITDKHELSHSAGAACKDLNIITLENGVYKWVPKAAPGRPMALLVMDNLLHRSKKKVDVPIFDMAALGDKIVAKLDSIAVQNENALRGSKSRMLGRALNQTAQFGDTLFSATESKQAVKLDILKAIAEGIYNYDMLSMNFPTEHIKQANAFIIQATEDLYNQFYGAKTTSLKAS